MTDVASNVPAGWYDDGAGRQRWWDGYAWSNTYQPVALSIAERDAHLNAAVMQWTVQGWQVQLVSNGSASLTRRRRIGWFWNTIGVIITAGLWLIYVIYRVVNPTVETAILTVDEYGAVKRVQ